MVQVARRAVDDVDGTLLPIRFALHDRDRKFCASFQDTLRSAGIQPLLLSSPQSKPESLCGTPGTLHQKRVSIEAILVW
jgi:hypothetical protein